MYTVAKENNGRDVVVDPSFPCRDIHFVGREVLLTDLERQLKQNKVGIINQVSATGLGGIGKSSLAIEYSWKHKNDYELIWFLRAEVEASLLQDYVRLGKHLGVPEGLNKEDLISAVKVKLGRMKTWLLVVDNARNATSINSYLPRGGHIIVTSRNKTCWKGRPLELPMFGDVDVINYVNEVCGKDHAHKEKDIKALGELLGYLPLAISQAIGFIRNQQISILGYIRLFERSKKRFLDKAGQLMDHDTVYVTVKTCLDMISMKEAVGVMKLCAFLAPDQIPEHLVKQWLEKMLKKEKKSKGNKQSWEEKDMTIQKSVEECFEEVIDTLQGYSLICKMAGSISVHRLVQVVIKETETNTANVKWLTDALDLVDNGFRFIFADAKTWKASREMVTHVQTVCLEAKKKRLELATVGRLYYNLGWYLQTQAQFDEALHCYQHSLEVCKEMYKTEQHEDIAHNLFAIGIVFQDKGCNDEALNYFQRSLKIYIEVYQTESHSNVATTINRIGRVSEAKGNYDEALDYYQRSLKILKEVHKTEMHVAFTVILTSIGSVLRRKRRYDEAEDYFQRSLRIAKQVYQTEPHTEVGFGLYCLGCLLQEKGIYDEAEEYLNEALGIYKTLLRMDHPYITDCETALRREKEKKKCEDK